MDDKADVKEEIVDSLQPPKGSQESASLVRRLAGASVTKAGLAKDQTEINRIIAEASKGSKFYENEKKKDKELSKRIENILRIREEVVKGVDLKKVEQAVDTLMADIEAHRDLTQIIVHVDMDAFFASVELLDNPSLAGKPFAVVGKGVLSTASYEARKFGVRSGMAGFIAKKLCPELIFIRNNFSRYMEMSGKVMDVLRRFDPTMAPAGCDECYLNITSYCEEHLITAAECVQQLRDAVFKETKLTASAGIAPNKMLAKICSDKNKPNGQFQLEFNSATVIAFMRDLPIRKVPGIGRVNERLLEAIGIKTCGDIYTQRATISLMDKQFGLRFLLQTHLGIASNVVEPHLREERKSIGAERTFSDLSEPGKILAKLEEIAEELEEDMKNSGWTGRTVTLKYKLNTYQVFTRAKSGTRWISTKEDLFAIGKELLMSEMPLTLRLIGLRVTKLKDLRNTEASTGIKRFFESATNESSRKRAKLENVDEENGAHNLEYSMLHSDDEATEDHDADMDEPMAGPSHIGGFAEPAHSPIRPKQSPRDQTMPEDTRTSHRGDNSTLPSISSGSSQEEQACPLCGRRLQTDNQGLNAHIDFCLSRGAIMEAQVETNKLPAEKKATSWLKPPPNKPKPTSKGKAPAFKSKTPSLSKS